MERIMVVPLRKARRGAKTRFAPKAVRYLREFVARHMKARDAEIVIGNNLNNFIWSRGRKNPPRRVEVRVLKREGKVFVELASIKEEEWRKFIGEKEKKVEKKEEEAREVLEEIAKESREEKKEKKVREKKAQEKKKARKGAKRKVKKKGEKK